MTSSLPAFAAIVVAAGTGSRSGGAKQWRDLCGKPVIRWSVAALLEAGAEDVIVVVAHGAEAEANAALSGLNGWRLTLGGSTRAASVQNGLAALTGPADRPVLIQAVVDLRRDLLVGEVGQEGKAALGDAHDGVSSGAMAQATLAVGTKSDVSVLV